MCKRGNVGPPGVPAGPRGARCEAPQALQALSSSELPLAVAAAGLQCSWWIIGGK